MNRVGATALAVLFSLMLIAAYGPTGNVGIDKTSVAVPGQDTQFWVNSNGVTTRWADSTEFAGAGPSGCRVSLVPQRFEMNDSTDALTHGFLAAGKMTSDTLGTADSTMSAGFMVPNNSYLTNWTMRTSLPVTTGAAPLCTLTVYVTGFGAGSSSLILSDSLNVLAGSFDSTRLVFAWPDSQLKVSGGSVVSILAGCDSALVGLSVGFDVFTTDSVP